MLGVLETDLEDMCRLEKSGHKDTMGLQMRNMRQLCGMEGRTRRSKCLGGEMSGLDKQVKEGPEGRRGAQLSTVLLAEGLGELQVPLLQEGD